MSGYVGDLNPQQEAALAEFKEAIQDIPRKPNDSDHYFLRWLRARKFDVHKAEAMFRNHMEYRKKYGADTILTDYTPPEVLTHCLAGGYFGEDLDGHPVIYDNFGVLDPRGLHRSIQLEDIMKYKCYEGERMDKVCQEFSEKKGKHIETVTAIFDFEDLSFQKHLYWPAIDQFKKLMAADEANNPERAKTVIMLKTPSIFPFCYNIVKHLMDERTRKKIVVLGVNSNWKEELQKYISPDQLPVMYGGTRQEPDDQCSNYLRQGGDVPPRFYMTNQTETSRNEMERITVGRGSAHKVIYEIEQVGSTLQWEFFTTTYDISYEVYIKSASKKDRVIIHPSCRNSSHLVPQTGHHCCEVPGTYVVKFDNTYSWTRSKEVFYSIKVLPPNVEPDPDILVAERLSVSLSSAAVSYTSNGECDEDEFHDCKSSNGWNEENPDPPSVDN